MANNQLQNQLHQLNPPIPPQAVALASDPVPIEVRRLRVANGSKRKRDLAAIRMAEELHRLESVDPADANLSRHWGEVRHLLRGSVPSATFSLWIEPLKPAGTDGQTLLLAAPEKIRAWAERRYAGLIREALATTGSDYTDVAFIGEGETCR